MKSIIVDLDGTLYCGNTLHRYLLTAFTESLAYGHFGTVARITCAYLLRGLRISSHHTFKQRALNAAGHNAKLLETFAKKARPNLNTRLINYIKQREKDGDFVLLATAAADFYVSKLWNGPMVCSYFDDKNELHECRGEVKLKAVLNQLKAKGIDQIDTVVTDHYDDLPLLQAAKNRILVNPSTYTQSTLRIANIEFRIF